MPPALFMVMNEQVPELSPKNRAALDKLTGLGMSLESAKLEANFGEIGLKKFRGLPGAAVISFLRRRRLNLLLLHQRASLKS